MDSFEIGVIYRKNSKLYLAVSESLLITFKDGQSVEVRPHAHYDVVRSISVDELCMRWRIELSDLDVVTTRYLAPSPTGIKPHPRGSRRRRQDEESIWREIRSGRIAKTA